MRWLAAGALLCALAVGPLAAPADARPRAAIAFLPHEDDLGSLLHTLAARPGMAIGLTSPTVGGFKPAQMALDIGQGTRIPTRLYDDELPRLRLVRDRVGGWERVRARADAAPGDVVPGLLAQTVERAGLRAGYAGTGRGPGLGAIAAANESGRLGLVSLGSAASLGTRAEAAWNDAALLAVDLPTGRAGLRALDRLLAARGRTDLVYVVRAPAGKKLRMLAAGVAGPDGAGRLRSDTTRRDGLVAAIDVGPTVLDALGLKVPDQMQGQPIEVRGEADPDGLSRTADRLSDVSGRRGPAVLAMLAAWLVLLALLRRRAFRLGLLAALWFPGVALLTAALRPGEPAEVLGLVLGSFGLAALTDRALRWPSAPALPAAVVLAAHTVDLAFGSPLIGAAVTGPNPAGGARFYGIGNELEVILAVTVLVGAGAALEQWRSERVPWGFAAAAALAAVVLGAGRLGADVGAVITLAAGGGAAAIAALGRRPSRRALAFAIAAPVVGVAALILIDIVTGGGAHLTRSVVDANGSGDLWDVVRRRFDGSLSSLKKPGQAVIFAAAVAGLAWMAAGRDGLLRGAAPKTAFHAGLVGAFFAVVIGAAANDSGPLIAEVGAVLLGLAFLYWRNPRRTAGPATLNPCE